jgi:excisionase family DNA binding protein
VSYVTIAEAAERLGVTRQAVLKAVTTGSLPATAVRERGKVVRYVLDPADVERRQASRSRPAGTYSVTDAAALLNVGATTVARWAADGKLDVERTESGLMFITPEALKKVSR